MSTGEATQGNGLRWIARVLSRSITFGFLWWVLGGNDPLWWWVGLPAVGLAVMVSLAFSPAPCRLRWSPGGLALFVPFFFIQSLRGGLDVARRALHPRLPLNPSLVRYPLRLEETPAQVFMANVVSLLPGTLSADLEGSVLIVHALDTGLPVAEQLHALESRVAHLFRIVMQSP
jgi:multicomponent Na+:H+ antiporter subunit E